MGIRQEGQRPVFVDPELQRRLDVFTDDVWDGYIKGLGKNMDNHDKRLTFEYTRYLLVSEDSGINESELSEVLGFSAQSLNEEISSLHKRSRESLEKRASALVNSVERKIRKEDIQPEDSLAVDRQSRNELHLKRTKNDPRPEGRVVKRVPTAIDTNRGTDPRQFEDPEGWDYFGRSSE